MQGTWERLIVPPALLRVGERKREGRTREAWSRREGEVREERERRERENDTLPLPDAGCLKLLSSQIKL